MSDRCDRLHAYVDGELADQDHLAFEDHLATCDACSADLPRLLALLVALDTAAEAASSAPSGSPRLTLVTGAPDPDRGHRASTAPPSRRRRSWWVAGGMAGGVAVAAGLLVVPSFFHRPAAPVVASLAGELGPTRHLEARLSYPGTEHHRPLDVTRGARTSEPISLERRVQLERAKDPHGLAVASLLAGERESASRSFSEAPSTPAVDSDRAALELLDGSPAALERALEDVDRALTAAPNHPAALWNRALVLAGLDMPLAAARELDHVQALGEPGWADEAQKRAGALRAGVMQRRTRWKQAYDAGRRLIEDGTPVPAELAEITGIMTIMLHDAVRAAPSRERVEALVPLAQALDGVYRSGRLTAYVRRIAASDFLIRAPLAETYRQLALGRPMASAAADGFLKQLEQTAMDDLRMGALVHTGRIGAQLAAYQRLAAATGDPWFAAIAEHEAAKAEIARGENAAAERRLRDAIGFARRERLAYRAILLEDELVSLHKRAHQAAQAAAVAQTEYREAASAGEWTLEMNALADVSAINQGRYANGLARGNLTELLERSESGAPAGASPAQDKYNCVRRRYAHESLASLALLFNDADRARAEVARAPACNEDRTLQSLLVRAELYRLGHRDEDARIARETIATLRATTSRSGEQALIAHVEGSLLIDADRTAGQRSLREAITQAGHQTDDFSVKARAYSFSLLALDAGRASELGRVIELLAEALDVRKPERCAVAIAAQGEQSVVAFLDASGETGGQFVATRRSPELDVAALVPASAVDRLRACAHVVVLARAPVLGAGRLLPPELAWSYLLDGQAASGAPPAATRSRRVVVANPLAPPELNLPPLGPLPEEPSNPDVLVLRGPDATPTRVLRAMRDASVVEFHTHGVIANDVSEASYLVLSPELDRQYAMTAGDVARVKLAAAPLIILGACHAATSSRSLEGGMGLAEAFLHAGARSVIASPEAVRDLDAQAFFAAVREAVQRGADPAVAVRDERLRRLAASRDDAWVGGVVVFESQVPGHAGDR